MIVVADSSPFIVLINIGHLNILPVLFGSVTIPPQVAEELSGARRAQIVRDFITNRPAWLRIQTPAAIEMIPHLQAGEAAAIILAQEIGADLLLIDEIEGRKVAIGRHIRFTGTIGVLELAASKQLLDLKDAFDRVKKTNFWILHRFLDERLNAYEKGH